MSNTVELAIFDLLEVSLLFWLMKTGFDPQISIGKSLSAGLRAVWMSGIANIVLLTQAAQEFFSERDDNGLKDSPEWTLPRCFSAAVMKLDLRN